MGRVLDMFLAGAALVVLVLALRAYFGPWDDGAGRVAPSAGETTADDSAVPASGSSGQTADDAAEPASGPSAPAGLASTSAADQPDAGGGKPEGDVRDSGPEAGRGRGSKAAPDGRPSGRENAAAAGLPPEAVAAARQVARAFLVEATSGRTDAARARIHPALARQFPPERMAQIFARAAHYETIALPEAARGQIGIALAGSARTADGCLSELAFEIAGGQIVSFLIRPLCQLPR